MTNPLVLSKRLARLREYVGLLKKLREQPRDRFISDALIFGNAERYTQLAIQVMLDIGNHIVADDKLGEASEYRNILTILGTAGVLPPDLVERLLPLVGLRNILVHDYLEVDRTKLYEALHTELQDFEEFAKHVSKLL